MEALSRQVGGGWGSVPILLLGVLAAPNAVIAGAAYLAGPGFAIGTGGTASALSTAHGVLPAFPLLGAMPQGHGATGPVWSLIALTPLAGAGAGPAGRPRPSAGRPASAPPQRRPARPAW